MYANVTIELIKQSSMEEGLDSLISYYLILLDGLNFITSLKGGV